MRCIFVRSLTDALKINVNPLLSQIRQKFAFVSVDHIKFCGQGINLTNLRVELALILHTFELSLALIL